MQHLQATWHKHTLDFKRPSGTSRGVLRQKTSWFIKVFDPSNPAVFGLGECGLLQGLSIDDRPDYEDVLQQVCDQITHYATVLHTELKAWPSIRFGLEMALLDIQHGGRRQFFDNDFAQGQKGIPINGLIWMGDTDYLETQIAEKIAAGYTTIKMKVGAIKFEQEFDVLQAIRKRYATDQITLRVDANGAFQPFEVIQKLERMAPLELHSIEQPIMAGEWDKMAAVCALSAVHVALDEELIGVHDLEQKAALLDTIQPPFIILKPSLLGGFAATQEWIDLADERGIQWWTTSALESNVGLNAIAQFTAQVDNGMVHGLGTGQLYTNNIDSPLYIEQGHIHYDADGTWNLPF